ncbi:MAG: tetratricopeptide repeat protein [Limnohabitans sp.]
MSLINKMLRDLDERERQTALNTARSVSSEVYAVQAARSHWQKSLPWVSGGLILILAAIVLFQYSDSGASRQAEVKVAAVSLPIADTVVPKTVAEVKPAAIENQPSAAKPSLSDKPLSEAEQLQAKGLVALQAGRTRDGMRDLRKAIELDPQLLLARLKLAKQLTALQRKDEAAELLSEGLMLLPSDPRLTHNLAGVWIRSGQADEAYMLLQQNLKNAGGNRYYHAMYAQLAQQKGLYDVAIEHYRKALLRDPNQKEWQAGLNESIRALEFKKDGRK